jgi:hypothetical protein
MRIIAFNVIALAVMASVLIAGCTFLTFTKNDYSSYFEKRITQSGATAVNPMSKVKDNVYTGAYRHNGTFTWTIEIAWTETAAKARYNQLMLEKQNAGYTPQSGSKSYGSICGDVKATWLGSKVNNVASTSCFSIFYAHNADIDRWVTATYAVDSSSFEKGSCDITTPSCAVSTQ